MYTKLKLLITLFAGMYIITSCNNGTTTDTDKTDTATTSSAQSDTANRHSFSCCSFCPSQYSWKSSVRYPFSLYHSCSFCYFDLDFANMMIIHHQGAIDMSNEELKSGTDEKMKKMAEKIITKQREENRETSVNNTKL